MSYYEKLNKIHNFIGIEKTIRALCNHVGISITTYYKTKYLHIGEHGFLSIGVRCAINGALDKIVNQQAY